MPRAVLHGDQGDLSRQHSKRKAEYDDRHRRLDWHIRLAGSGVETAPTPVPQVLLSGSLVTFLVNSTSGGLFQGIDHLFEDVRAMIGYLLENGVSELLQLGVIPFNFLQLILKLKGKRGRVQVEFRLFVLSGNLSGKKWQAELMSLYQKECSNHTFLDSLHESKVQRSQC